MSEGRGLRVDRGGGVVVRNGGDEGKRWLGSCLSRTVLFR